MADDIFSAVAQKYRTLGQQGLPANAAPATPAPPVGLPPANITFGQTAGKVSPIFGKNGQFGDVGVGKTATVGGFNATNWGPGLPAVISGKDSPIGDIENLMSGAGGMTAEEATRAVQAASAATLGLANADAVPIDTASQAALRAQQGRLAGDQGTEALARASVIPSTAAASNAANLASAYATRTGADINLRNNPKLDGTDQNTNSNPGGVTQLLKGFPGVGLGWLKTKGGLF